MRWPLSASLYRCWLLLLLVGGVWVPIAGTFAGSAPKKAGDLRVPGGSAACEGGHLDERTPARWLVPLSAPSGPCGGKGIAFPQGGALTNRFRSLNVPWQVPGGLTEQDVVADPRVFLEGHLPPGVKPCFW